MTTDYLSILQRANCFGCGLTPRQFQILIIMGNRARAPSQEEIAQMSIPDNFRAWSVLEVRISQSKIAEKCACSVRTVQRALKELKKRRTVEQIAMKTRDKTDGSVSTIHLYRIFLSYMELRSLTRG